MCAWRRVHRCDRLVRLQQTQPQGTTFVGDTRTFPRKCVADWAVIAPHEVGWPASWPAE